QAAIHRDVQAARPVLFLAEGGRHAALALDAVLEGHAGEIALAVVAPGVVDALEAVGAARFLERDQRAAVRAAVLEAVDLAVVVAHHRPRRGADEGGPETARLGDLDVQAEVVPDRSLEDLVLFARIDIGVVIDAVRHPR